VPSGDVERGR